MPLIRFVTFSELLQDPVSLETPIVRRDPTTGLHPNDEALAPADAAFNEHSQEQLAIGS
jgi:hypothetical protein